MRREIRIAGTGGMGVVLAGVIVGNAAVISGLNGQQQGVFFWFGFKVVFSYALQAGGPSREGFLMAPFQREESDSQY